MDGFFRKIADSFEEFISKCQIEAWDDDLHHKVILISINNKLAARTLLKALYGLNSTEAKTKIETLPCVVAEEYLDDMAQ